MSEKLLPCPFCGGDARTFEYDGANQATCGGKHIDCAGTDVVAPVAMWNRRTPAPEGEACPHDAYETDAAGQAVRCVDCGMAIASAASPVVPAPEGEAWRHVSQEEMAQAAKFASNNLASPVVPAPEGEVVAWVRPTELAELADPHHPRREIHIWGHRPWTGFVPLYASPVVPVGVSEADINELRVVCDTNQAATDDSRIVRADDLPIGVIRRIIAALRPTDTGRE